MVRPLFTASLLLATAMPALAQAAPSPHKVKIVLTGDSTTAVGGGWGPGFCAVWAPNVTCLDVAANGRSSKSYIDEGKWKAALAEKGDYYTIQFGHNDQPGKGPERETDPETTYAANLRRMVRDVRAQGAVPVLVTPLTRRNYKDGKLLRDMLEQYAAATRRIAREEKVALVDLYKLSTGMMDKLTQEQADAYDAEQHPDAVAEAKAAAAAGTPIKADHGTPDRTHLNEKGKAVFGRMVAEQLVKAQVELAPDLLGVPSGQTDHP